MNTDIRSEFLQYQNQQNQRFETLEKLLQEGLSSQSNEILSQLQKSSNTQKFVVDFMTEIVTDIFSSERRTAKTNSVLRKFPTKMMNYLTRQKDLGSDLKSFAIHSKSSEGEITRLRKKIRAYKDVESRRKHNAGIYKTKIDELSLALDECREEIISLRQENEVLQKRSDDKHNEVESIHNLILKLKKKAAVMKQREGVLRGKYQKAKQRLNENVTLVDELQTRESEMVGNTVSVNEYEKLKMKVQLKENEAMKKILVVEKEYRERENTLRKQIETKYKNRINELEKGQIQTLESHQTQLFMIGKQKDELKERLTKRMGKIKENYQTEKIKHLEEISKLEQRGSKIEALLTKEREKCQKFQSKYEKENRKRVTLFGQNSKITKTIETLRDIESKFKKEKERLIVRIESKNKDLDVQYKKIKLLEKDKEKLRAKIIKLGNEKKDIVTWKREREIEKLKENKKITELKNERDIITTQFDDYKLRMEKVSLENARKCEGLEGKIFSLLNQKNEVEKKNLEISMQGTAHKSQLKRLENERNEIKKQSEFSMRLLKKELDSEKTKCANMIESVEKCKVDISKLRDENLKLKKTVEDQQNKTVVLSTEVGKYKKFLEMYEHLKKKYTKTYQEKDRVSVELFQLKEKVSVLIKKLREIYDIDGSSGSSSSKMSLNDRRRISRRRSDILLGDKKVRTQVNLSSSYNVNNDIKEIDTIEDDDDDDDFSGEIGFVDNLRKLSRIIAVQKDNREKEIAKLRNEMAFKERELEHFKLSQRNECELLRAKLVGLRKTNQEIKNLAKNKTREIFNVFQRQLDLVVDMNKQEQLSGTEKLIQLQRSHTGELERIVGEYKDKLVDQKNSYKNELDKIHERVSDLTIEKQNLNIKFASMDKENKVYKKKYKDLYKMVEIINGYVSIPLDVENGLLSLKLDDSPEFEGDVMELFEKVIKEFVEREDVIGVKKVTHLETQLSLVKQDRDKFLDRLEQKQVENTDILDTLTRTREMVSKLERKINVLGEEKTEIDSQYESQKLKMQQDIIKLRNKNNQLRENFLGQIDTLKEQINGLKKSFMSDVKKQIRERDERIGALENEKNRTIISLKNKLRMGDDEVDNLRKERRKITDKLDLVGSQLSSALKKIEIKKKKMAQKERKIKEYKNIKIENEDVRIAKKKLKDLLDSSTEDI